MVFTSPRGGGGGPYSSENKPKKTCVVSNIISGKNPNPSPLCSINSDHCRSVSPIVSSTHCTSDCAGLSAYRRCSCLVTALMVAWVSSMFRWGTTCNFLKYPPSRSSAYHATTDFMETRIDSTRRVILSGRGLLIETTSPNTKMRWWFPRLRTPISQMSYFDLQGKNCYPDM